MTKLLLALHVLAAIIAVGPVTVAASMFPAAVRRARPAVPAGPHPDGPHLDGPHLDDPDPFGPDLSGPGSGGSAVASVRLLHRICRVYAVVGLAVPVFGFGTASSLGVLSQAWLIVSIVITAVAAGVLAFLVLPRQDALLARIDGSEAPVERAETAHLAMMTGLFNLLWATVTVLMIIRPGSTTGV